MLLDAFCRIHLGKVRDRHNWQKHNYCKYKNAPEKHHAYGFTPFFALKLPTSCNIFWSYQFSQKQCKWRYQQSLKLFHDGDPYHIETSPLVCFPNQWTGLYMVGTSVIKELKTKTLVHFIREYDFQKIDGRGGILGSYQISVMELFYRNS